MQPHLNWFSALVVGGRGQRGWVYAASCALLLACGGSTASGAGDTRANGGDQAGGSASNSSAVGGAMPIVGGVGGTAAGQGSASLQGTGGVSVANGGNGATVGGAATGTGGAGASAAIEPVDTRPARPAWIQPFATALGAPGWKQSTEPICETNQGLDAGFDVWADERGVFALVESSGCNIFANVACGKNGASLKFNSGSGWQLLYQFAPGTAEFPALRTGFANGSLLMTGAFDGQVGVGFASQGSFTFQLAAAEASGAFGVGDSLAYVTSGTTLLQYSGGVWSTVGESTGRLLAVWADSETVIAVGEDQTVLMKTGSGALAPIAGVPAGTYTSVWAFGPRDIWFGNQAGQLLHYDGSRWQTIPIGSRDGSGAGIAQLWGVAGTIYFITSGELGRWNGTSVEMLLAPPAGTDVSSYPASFQSVWGRSANEVFITLRDMNYRKYACGSVFMLWFDGAEFHQM